MSFISAVGTDANGNPIQTGANQELGKDDFLELLVTKLQYQDPLNPMEDEDFIAQLAQFSSLEQLSNIAGSMEYSNEIDYLQMQSINNTMSADFIGKEIKADYSGVYLDESGDSVISFTTAEYAEDIQFVITDSRGSTVATLEMKEVEAGVNTLDWNGKDDLGNRVDAGYYSVVAEATDATGNTFTPSLSLIGTVSAISFRDGAAFLKVNGMEIALGDVIAIGEPETLPKKMKADKKRFMKMTTGGVLKINNYQRPVNLLEISQRNKPDTEAKKVDGDSFQQMFSAELADDRGEQFSRHASERLYSRGIEFDSEQLNNIADAIDKAELKGSKETLILTDEAALVVAVKNRTVITAFDRDNLREGVITSIDSAVII